jgi:L,D-transpeptidase catalytic domain
VGSATAYLLALGTLSGALVFGSAASVAGTSSMGRAGVMFQAPLSGALREQRSERVSTLETLAEPAGNSATQDTNGMPQVMNRLMTRLPPDLYQNFDLFLYVSKAQRGPWAQHMYVFAKERGPADAKLILLENWPVSTGREAMEHAKNGERVSTETPAGFYELDPDRFFVQYRSTQWQRDMPNAMFFNWPNRGYQTGLAIHGVTDTDQVAALGQRASAGCVQLPLKASEKLFDLVRDNFEGEVPRLAYDEKTRTTSNDGTLARDENGELRMMNGYRVLVVIEDYGGAPVTSELSVDSPGPAG